MGLVLNDSSRALLAKYPLYSQDGKKGEALAVLRLFLTGTDAAIYILEAEPQGADFLLFAVTSMTIGGRWEYGYYSFNELAKLNAYGGAVHVAQDMFFKPTRLADLPDVADGLKYLWTDEQED